MIPFFRRIRKKLADNNRFLMYARYAIGEIILVVIGILIALEINNWNEMRIERQQIEKYAKSLIKDLQSDIDMLQVSMYQAEVNYRCIDSLKTYMLDKEPQEISNTLLFVLTNDIMYKPYFWNRSTFEELKGSGRLRFIKNDSLEKKIVAYEAYSRHLDEDFNADKVNAEKANDLMEEVLKLNSAHISNLSQWLFTNFNSPFEAVFQSKEFIDAKANDLSLEGLSKDKLKQFINRYILIQDNYRTRAFKEMPEIIADARSLIALLRKEYPEK